MSDLKTDNFVLENPLADSLNNYLKEFRNFHHLFIEYGSWAKLKGPKFHPIRSEMALFTRSCLDKMWDPSPKIPYSLVL